MSPLLMLLVTAGIIVLSAFFVIIEFSLLAARRHRLEDSAETSASSRAALRSLNELTIMLAGAQLGITACTFALGAVTKPAVHYALTPVFLAWQMPPWVADAVAFVLALGVVTFLHLVVGEMAPKSWAIAHPELSARSVAVPARVFIGIFRPLLRRINAIANRLVAATGVEPVERAAAAGYDAETIGRLVEHSTRAGVLDEASGTQISSIIGLEKLTVDDVLKTRRGPATAVHSAATVAEVQAAAGARGHLRVLVGLPGEGLPLVVHVRDTLRAPGEQAASDLARPPLLVASGDSVYEAFQKMRAHGEQLAVVGQEDQMLGVITWSDVLKQIWPTVEEHLTDGQGNR